MTTFTHAQYMAAPYNPGNYSAHRRYYAQFVSPAVVSRVVSAIGADELRQSCDPHFNDISLHRWDAVARNLGPLPVSFASLGDFTTLGGLVCVAKEAARQYVEKTA